MNKRLIISAAVCLITAAAAGSAQQYYWANGTGTVSLASSTIGGVATTGGVYLTSPGPGQYSIPATFTMPLPAPPGAIFHQVTDTYFDAHGSQIEVRSATHAVRGDCTQGTRSSEDLISQDDGHGGVRFVQLLLPSEPTQGQPAITAADRVKVILAASNKSPEPEQVPLVGTATRELASTQ